MPVGLPETTATVTGKDATPPEVVATTPTVDTVPKTRLREPVGVILPAAPA